MTMPEPTHVRDAPSWEGHFFEDFAVGDRYRHRLGRTISTVDNSWFTQLTLNTNPAHFDAHYSAQTPFGRPLVNSCFTLALITGLSVSDISQNAIANLGWEQVLLPAPVFEGDTLYAETTVLSARLSESRPNAGIIQVLTRGYNQDGATVMEFTRSVMVYRRGRGPVLPDRPAPSGAG